MKQATLYSVIAVLTALLLPILFPPTPPTADPAPAAYRDSTVSVTVWSEGSLETTDLHSYLPHVLAGEMPALFEAQALMAQAVAARTYILHRKNTTVPAHPEADVCTDPACCKAYAASDTLRQNWGDNYDSYWAKLTAAVGDTDGIYLTYGGEPIEAVFHSSSAGATEASESIWNARPYLVSVTSPETSEDVPNYVTEVVLSAEALREKLRAAVPEMQFPADPAAWFTDISHTEGGRASHATVCGVSMEGTALRSALGLRSTAFTVGYENGSFTFTVTGYGHGVGMSQYGANVFAKQGWTYDEILAHYYPDTQPASISG